MRSSTTRRRFLGAGLALPLAAELGAAAPLSPRSGSGKKLLVLGGTRFLGPAIVDAALERGYEVTLFNRGKSNPHLYPDLEKLRGDRDTGDLEALRGRRWDLVVDPSAYLPSHARAMAELLADSVEHYVLISTLSVYGESEGYVITEDSPVIPITEEDVGQVQRIGDVMRVGGGRFYGPLKALCEEAVEEVMPGRTTSLRPGVIAGRGDPSDRLPYWAVRTVQGGEILAPEDRQLGIQFTDVRDLGICSVEFGEQRTAGIFNTAGFPGRVSMEELLYGCKVVLNSDCSFTWVAEEFLLEQGVRPFVELPFWLPAGAVRHYDNQRALAAGMAFRPLAETIRETVDWHFEERGQDYRWRVYGMQPEREQELLAAWAARE